MFNSGLLRKIDQCSNLVFQTEFENSHHSISTDNEGNIWVPTNIYPQSLPKEIVGRGHFDNGGSKEDGILKYSSSGKPRVSSNSEYAS